MQDNFVLSLICSVSIAAFLAMLFYDMRAFRMEDSGRQYRPHWDYYYVYGWVIISAIVSVLISTTIGRSS